MSAANWQAMQQQDEESRAEIMARLLNEAQRALGDRGKAWREEFTNAAWNLPAPEKPIPRFGKPF